MRRDWASDCSRAVFLEGRRRSQSSNGKGVEIQGIADSAMERLASADRCLDDLGVSRCHLVGAGFITRGLAYMLYRLDCTSSRGHRAGCKLLKRGVDG